MPTLNRWIWVIILSIVIVGTATPMFMVYKVVAELRKKVLHYRVNPLEGPITRAELTDVAYFAPYFAASTMLGTIILMIVGAVVGVVVNIILSQQIRDYILTRASFWVLIGTYVGKRVLFWILRLLLLDTTGTRIVHRVAFGFADYMTVFYALPTGLVSALLRVVVPLAHHFIFIGRVDVGNFPPAWETFDLGHRSYLAAVLVETLHSNPVAYTFCTKIAQEISQNRLKNKPISSYNKSSNHTSYNDSEHEIGNDCRRQQIRFRFWLCFTLARNPSLTAHRKHRLAVVHEGAVYIKKFGKKLNRRLILKQHVLLLTTVHGETVLSMEVVNIAVSSSIYHSREFQIVDLKSNEGVYVRTRTLSDHDEWIETLVNHVNQAHQTATNPNAAAARAHVPTAVVQRRDAETHALQRIQDYLHSTEPPRSHFQRRKATGKKNKRHSAHNKEEIASPADLNAQSTSVDKESETGSNHSAWRSTAPTLSESVFGQDDETQLVGGAGVAVHPKLKEKAQATSGFTGSWGDVVAEDPDCLYTDLDNHSLALEHLDPRVSDDEGHDEEQHHLFDTIVLASNRGSRKNTTLRVPKDSSD
eukprot:TRINITY_DN85035_c0_g1_i1.p1 TRINITY_DN85035_c0_g1~~TRINITY_DN85035_c0_g1_i1.p1  ORF type:complete len:612 (+),score=36.78 TRINITY_DN85035_c0_g1_i1:77-1837(+)